VLAKQSIKDIFMVIEEPEDPLHFSGLRMALAAGEPPRTIGQF
jgi:hypothetical protein